MTTDTEGFVTAPILIVEGQVLSTFSSPCFGVKTVYDYGLLEVLSQPLIYMIVK
jgi:hypothetical protein